MNEITTWRPGYFIMKREYEAMPERWKKDQREREPKLVRPHPEGNAICECQDPDMAAWIADRLNIAAEYERLARISAETLYMSPDECAAWTGITKAQELAHKTATDAGWYRDRETGEPIKRNFGEVVALMHSELSEALEADRKNLMDDHLPHRDGRAVEFADCIIRILDTAEAEGLDVAGALIEKNRYNRERADHKLAARAAGGKKY